MRLSFFFFFFPYKTQGFCSIHPLPEEGNGGQAGITHKAKLPVVKVKVAPATWSKPWETACETASF